MSILNPAYKARYGYRWRDAILAEFWWRVEHVGPEYTGSGPWTGDNGLWPRLNNFGYVRRKQAERRGTHRKAAA